MSVPNFSNILVCALLVTGKDDQRIVWARNQVQDFILNQNILGQKHILIANEHPKLSVCQDQTENRIKQNVTEIKINNRFETTLGAIRNKLLDLVPQNAFVFILDDDDHIHPTILQEMFLYWKSQDETTALIQLGTRLNHNISTCSSWQSKVPSGFVHFLADINLLRSVNFRYLEKDAMEDLSLYQLPVGSVRTVWKDNPANLYVRYIHKNNTSLYVDPLQQEAYYHLGEKQVIKEMHDYCVRFAPQQSFIFAGLTKNIVFSSTIFITSMLMILSIVFLFSM